MESTSAPDPIRDRLHYRNLAYMAADDIIVPSFGGAGAALLGNILLELGLRYVNPGTEELGPDGSSVPDASLRTYRGRLAATHRRDAAGSDDLAGGGNLRFVKTHLPPAEFERRPHRGVWLLVRDPRDALYSAYQWRLRFPDLEWEKTHGTFADHLNRPEHTGHRPVREWTLFYQQWLDFMQSHEQTVVTRFEDLKLDGIPTIRTALQSFGVRPATDAVRGALQRSSYESMRAHEDTVAALDRDKGGARIMRRGKVDEWKEWMTPELARHFRDEATRSIARRLGYSLPS